MATVTRTPLPFNRHVLTWARKRRGLSLEDAAKAASVKADRIVQWESGDRAPTVRQGRMLAKLYDRPFLEFFAKTRPEVPEVELVPDYRFHRDPPSVQEHIALEEIQRWAEEQRANALSLFNDLGETPPKLPEGLRFTVKDSPSKAASFARASVGFTVDDQIMLKSSHRYKLPGIIRERIEASGVLVLKQSGIQHLRTRGVCLFAEPLPVVIFGNESSGAQAFTLAHEFGHVALGESGISGAPRFGKNSQEKMSIENWCNRFAAAFLVPKDVLSEVLPLPSNPMERIDDELLSGIANRFAISRHAMLIRLVQLRYVSKKYYWGVMRPRFLNEEGNYKSFGRPKYYGTRYVNSRGRMYTGLVLEAWGRGGISAHNAAEYMGISNLQHLQDIRQNFWSDNG